MKRYSIREDSVLDVTLRILGVIAWFVIVGLPGGIINML